ncbi:hypothetical protein C8R47DRAFT_1065313 [Mycena vitilis]|nr:hypothetical protein C8R47DRAFT_1065313 [Mycena vitilis]
MFFLKKLAVKINEAAKAVAEKVKRVIERGSAPAACTAPMQAAVVPVATPPSYPVRANGDALLCDRSSSPFAAVAPRLPRRLSRRTSAERSCASSRTSLSILYISYLTTAYFAPESGQDVKPEPSAERKADSESFDMLPCRALGPCRLTSALVRSPAVRGSSNTSDPPALRRAFLNGLRTLVQACPATPDYLCSLTILFMSPTDFHRSNTAGAGAPRTLLLRRSPSANQTSFLSTSSTTTAKPSTPIKLISQLAVPSAFGTEESRPAPLPARRQSQPRHTSTSTRLRPGQKYWRPARHVHLAHPRLPATVTVAPQGHRRPARMVRKKSDHTAKSSLEIRRCKKGFAKQMDEPVEDAPRRGVRTMISSSSSAQGEDCPGEAREVIIVLFNFCTI